MAAEFALVKLRATRGSREGGRVPRGSAGGRVPRLDRYLGVTQLGITLASLGLGWIGEPAIAELGQRLRAAFTGHELGPTGRVVVAIAFALLTLFHVLFGELVPKLVAIQRSRPPDRPCRSCTRLIRAVSPLVARSRVASHPAADREERRRL